MQSTDPYTDLTLKKPAALFLYLSGKGSWLDKLGPEYWEIQEIAAWLESKDMFIPGEYVYVSVTERFYAKWELREILGLNERG